MTARTRTGSTTTAARTPSRVPRHAILAIVIGLVAAWPAAASAAPVNRASDRVALGAYHAYLQDLVSMVPAWRRADDAYVASISGKCGGALDPLKHLPAGSFNKQALFAFGLEAGGDLDAVGVYPSAGPALAKLAASLAPLHWSSAGVRKVVSGYVTAERSLFAVAPSNLCADARALSSAHGKRVSHGTGAFVSKFAHRVGAAGKAADSFLTVLGRFAAPSERGQLGSTNHLLHEFAAKVTAFARPEATKLVGVLGL